MLALCQHNTLAYYSFYYAGTFDTDLLVALNKTFKTFNTSNL